jgi:hypothetical protein
MPRKTSARTKNSKSHHKQSPNNPNPSRSTTQQLQSSGTLQHTNPGPGASQSSRGPSAVRRGRPKKAIEERGISEPRADPELINGSTYFKVNIYLLCFIPGTE